MFTCDWNFKVFYGLYENCCQRHYILFIKKETHWHLKTLKSWKSETTTKEFNFKFGFFSMEKVQEMKTKTWFQILLSLLNLTKYLLSSNLRNKIMQRISLGFYGQIGCCLTIQVKKIRCTNRETPKDRLFISSGFLRRPTKKVWTLLSNVQTLGKIAQTFCGLLRNPEL